jgi:hypothetical protein
MRCGANRELLPGPALSLADLRAMAPRPAR